MTLYVALRRLKFFLFLDTRSSLLQNVFDLSTGDYIINGSKMWITNGIQADWMCLLANTSEGSLHQNKSLIVLPMNTPGITVAKDIRKIGMHSSDTAQLFFEDVRVPQKHLIGDEGMGFTYQMLQFVDERVFGAASGKFGRNTVK